MQPRIILAAFLIALVAAAFTGIRPSFADLGDAPGLTVFVSNRDGNNEIYSMNPDGTGQARLTNNPANDTNPSISADQTKIAFVSNRDGNNEIYVMNGDGTGVTRVTNNPANDDKPEVYGSTIIFVSNRDGNNEIYSMNIDGTGVTRLTNNAADDTDPARMYGYIAFSSNRDGNYEIYMMKSDGTSQTRLTDNSARDVEPTWSYDGTAIAFTSNRDGNNEIYGIDAAGGHVTNLTNNAADDQKPNWSPSNADIIFQTNRDGNNELYTEHVCIGCGAFFAVSNLTRLTNNTASDTNPDYSNEIVQPQPTTHNISVSALSIDGSTVLHMWTVIRSGDTVLQTGFTPITFTGDEGVTYTVTVSNYQNIIFDHWNGGSTNATRTVTLSADTALTAFYNTGSTLRGFTTLTFTGTTARPDLTVSAKSMADGHALHMWTTINAGTTTSSGTQYTVTVQDYLNRHFDHWNDGSTSRTRTLTISSASTITAYYQTG